MALENTQKAEQFILMIFFHQKKTQKGIKFKKFPKK